MAVIIRHNDPAVVTAHEISKFIYGEPKIGKTTFLSKVPNNLIFDFEKGTKFIDCDVVNINSYADYLQALSLLDQPETKAKFKSVTLDTIDIWADKVKNAFCKSKGITYVGDLAHGKGWDLIKQEYRRMFYAIVDKGYIVHAISHERERTLEFRGNKIDRMMPTANNQIREVVLPYFDLIGYYFADGVIIQGKTVYRRSMDCVCNPNQEGGDRTGIFKDRLVLEPAEKCYDRFVEAYKEYMDARNAG